MSFNDKPQDQHDADPKTQLDWLQQKLVKQVSGFGRRRDHNRRQAYRYGVATSLLGAFTTVVIGLQQNQELFGKQTALLSVVALVSSACVSVLAAWEAFFDPRWLWVRYTTTLNALYNLQDELEYYKLSEHPLEQKQIDELFAKLQMVLQETDAAWAQKRASGASAYRVTGPTSVSKATEGP